MPGITDHPDDFDREWAYRRGYAHGAAAVVAALRSHLPEEIRRRAEVWLASEMTPWRAQFQPKMTRPPELRGFRNSAVGDGELANGSARSGPESDEAAPSWRQDGERIGTGRVILPTEGRSGVRKIGHGLESPRHWAMPTKHFDLSIRYVGRAEQWDDLIVEGDPSRMLSSAFAGTGVNSPLRLLVATTGPSALSWQWSVN